MKRQVGRVSLGLLCLVAGGLWLAYKFEYLQLLVGAVSGRADTGFDVAAEQRLLLFILSPGLVLIVVGLVLLVRSMFRRSKPTSGAITT
jgi:hypothetical protein